MRRLALVLSVSAVLAPCALAGGYSGHGVSFGLPDGWRHVPVDKLSAQTGNRLWHEWFAPDAGARIDLVGVAAYRSNVSVDASNLASYRDDITAGMRQLAAQSGGKVLAGPVRVSLGGLPGYRYELSGLAADGSPIHSRSVLAWRGRTEYFVTCQYALGGTRAGAIAAGCARVASTFRVR